jgi:hypothetical protein
MKIRKMVKAASANHAAREAPFSAVPSIWFCHSADRTQWLSTTQGWIAAASADSSQEFQTIALDRWENEGGRVGRPDGVATAHSLMVKE